MFSRNVVSRSRQWYFLLVLLLLLPAIANADQFYGGGDGSEQTPFQINTAAHLIELSNRPEHWISDTYFVLTDDIDMDPNVTGVPPFPCALIAPHTGVGEFRFSGNFDGAGHIISNLHINAPDSQNVGLFGFLAGKVEKLGLENVSVIGKNYVGALTGFSRGIISECYSTGTVNGYMFVGGLMAGDHHSVTSNCYSAAFVTGESYVAGLHGCSEYSSNPDNLTHCYSTGAVSGTDIIHGLAIEGNLGSPFNSFWDVDTFNSFWDVDTSGVTSGRVTGVAGLSTGHMKSMKFYSLANFPSDVWTIDDGNDYPRLAWENKPGVPIEEVDSVIAGTGTPEDPYQIADTADLRIVSFDRSFWDKHLVLTTDLDMSGVYMWPIGDMQWEEHLGFFSIEDPYRKFEGVFDGREHVISNLTVSETEWNCVGLFSCIESPAEVKNLGLENVLIEGRHKVGGLIGRNKGMISQCYVTGSVNGNEGVGGLVGDNISIIDDCYSRASVNGYKFVSGLVGSNFSLDTSQGGPISRCYSAGPVSGDEIVCGFTNCGPVFDCFWDINLNPDLFDINYTDFKGVQELSTEGMQYMSTYSFAGWPADVWTIDDGKGYPRLAWENADGDNIAELAAGSPDDPIIINNAYDIINLSSCNELWDRNFLLSSDINMDPSFTGQRAFTNSPIAPDTGSEQYFQGTMFTGSFDGNGHVISNLHIDAKHNDIVGLFGAVGESGQIRKLGLDNVSIVGLTFVGALSGWNKGIVNQCYSTGSVFASQNPAGGLLGYSEGPVSQSYSHCSVQSQWENATYIGGLAGRSKDVIQCYSSGPVSNTFAGGLIGDLESGGSIIDCYWDIDTSGTTDSDGGTGLSTGDMMQVDSFVGWDFVGEIDNGDLDIWRLCQDGSGYPKLAWEFAGYGDFVCPDGVWYEDFDYFDIRWQQDGCDGIFGDEGGTVDIDVLANICNLWLTAECSNCQGSDLNGDGDVNVKDFSKMASQWLCTSEVNWNRADLDGNGTVGYEDLDILAESWINGL